MLVWYIRSFPPHNTYLGTPLDASEVSKICRDICDIISPQRTRTNGWRNCTGKWSLRVINLLSIWEVEIHLHYTMRRLICTIILARTRDCGILSQISLKWDSPIIQNLMNFLCLVNIFSNARISRYDLNKLSMTTSKLGKCNDNHIPTLHVWQQGIFSLSQAPPPLYYKWSSLPNKMLVDHVQSFVNIGEVYSCSLEHPYTWKLALILCPRCLKWIGMASPP